MPSFLRGATTIYYETSGSGPPLLLVAPGGMHSSVERWQAAALNPLECYPDDFLMIAMDQRNAGRSTGPLPSEDPWGSYAEDALALMDHLGFETFLAMGCCIGPSFILKQAQLDPSRVLAAVLEQPIGVADGNQGRYEEMWRSWGGELVQARGDVDSGAVEEFGRAMWDGRDFVLSVDRDFVAHCATPLLVLPGVDQVHPNAIGLEVAALAPRAELVEPWRDSPARLGQSVGAVREFLKRHSPTR